ncbi:MAG: SPASM domain-containing protein [Magnetococcales bacterium]|nr:SPASM domain-containing protein [Magnetococcales bacterium]
MPREVSIELTNHCNLACVMCPHGTMQRGKGFMEQALFERIIDQCRGQVELVYLYGTGESLLDNRLPGCIRYAKERGLATDLSTNGTLLNEAWARELLTSGLDFLTVCLDGGDKETYESIRIKGNFTVLVANIRTLLRVWREVSSRTRIIIQMIVMDRNLNEVEGFRNLFTSEERNAVFQFRIKPFYDTYRIPKEQIGTTPACFLPWNQMSILWNGDVALCCFDANGKVPLGNVWEQPLRDIWNGTVVQRIRHRQRTGQVHDLPLCSSCGVPRQGYFNPILLFGSAFFRTSRIRILIPYYEQHVLDPARKLLGARTAKVSNDRSV